MAKAGAVMAVETVEQEVKGLLNKKGEVRKAPVARADNFKQAWKVQPKSQRGMSWGEALAAFLRSRKLGLFGASKAVKPRTIAEYEWDLQKFFDFCTERGITNYAELNEQAVLSYFEFLQNSSWSKATQRKYLISLKAFFRWVERDTECKGMRSWTHLLPRIGKEIRRMFVPSKEQMEAFLNGFDKAVVWGLRDYIACALMMDTGARIGEICNLEYNDFRWQAGLVNLDGKTGERLIPFSDAVGNMVKDWMRVRTQFANEQCEKLFVTRFGYATTPDTFRQSFEDNLKRIGLDKVLGKETISCHTIRHYFCTMYLVNGGTLHNLQRITGHKSLETLMIYVNLAQQINTVAEEHRRVSPLNDMLNKPPQRKRNIARF